MVPEEWARAGIAVDVVVATHDARRPTGRAVASALQGLAPGGILPTGERVRVTVVCHEVSVSDIREQVEAQWGDDLRAWGRHAVRYLAVQDGLGSPSGPFNAGIAAADGRYVSIIGSDDWYAPGALASWVRRADELASAWLMARLETQQGEHIATPRTRPGRTRELDFVKDRLAYRTAPLGLLRTGILRDVGMEQPLVPGMRTGGDIVASVRLATSGVRIDYGLDLPAYVIGTVGGDRITEAPRPLAMELAAHCHLIDQEWVAALSEDQRHALVVKVLRIHVLGAVRRRTHPEQWAPDDPLLLRTLLMDLLALAPHGVDALHRADADLIRMVLRAQGPEDLALAATHRGQAGRWDILLTDQPLANLDRESTARAHVEQALTQVRGSAAEKWGAPRPAGRHRQTWRDRVLSATGLSESSPARSILPVALRGESAPADPAVPAASADGLAEGPVSAEVRDQRAVLAGARVLILAFSPLLSDARVLKQVRVLSQAGADVVTVGYGPAPEGVTRHIQIPDGLGNRLDGRLITAKTYRAAYWAQEAIRWVRSQIPVGAADLILANDTDTVPLALALRPAQGVHADLHEYWPRWREEHSEWAARIGPYQLWLCQTYLPRCAAVTTVSPRIAAEYAATCGIAVGVITNASPAADLSPTPVAATGPIRLVHSGACLRSRGIHVMMEAVIQYGLDRARAARARGPAAPGGLVDITLDLYLTPNDPDYLAELRALARTSHSAVQVHGPVPYAELFTTLNRYDMGVFLLPPVNFNYANALPNKIFDFVQSRLGVIVGPSPDMAQVVREHGIGLVAEGFTAADLTRLLQTLTPAQVGEAKEAADRAAPALDDSQMSPRWVAALSAIREGRPPLRGLTSPEPEVTD